MKKTILLCAAVALMGSAAAQHNDTVKRSTLDELTVSSRHSAGISRLGGAENGHEIGQDELFRAACCNLGESFVANPSVDVNYNDAAVGARQIKLLGLSGQYVQMLIEGLPTSTGASMPYSLGLVPGAWMQSLSVSKGAASVKNGPQSITGQINVEYVKPSDEPGLHLNLYGDSWRKTEGNLVGNAHLGRHLSTMVLAHYERDFAHHDSDGDGWHDSPNVRQLHLQNRWKYQRGRYIMHAGAGYVDEEREGGQLLSASDNPYRVLIGSRRAEAYMKHAYLLNREHNTNVALLATGSVYQLDGTFGTKLYDARQHGLYSQLIVEHDFTEAHGLSAGVGLTSETVDERLTVDVATAPYSQEHMPGAYAQYTYKPSYRFTAMAGLRVDHSTLYDRTFATPRLHVKWTATDHLTFRLSSGKGYRTPHVLAENHYLLASGRKLVCEEVPQEEAWNSGASVAWLLPVGERMVRLNAEYYYTHFLHQAVVDFDSDPMQVTIADLSGRSFSHTMQVDASVDISDELNVLAAMRYNVVRCTYGGRLMEKPLTSRYKGLVTCAWKPMMGLWQVDVTLALNGGGRMPEPYITSDGTPSWDREFPAYPTLSAQLTREFRHWSVYVGGENLTGYRQPNPVINAANPWSDTFDPTMIWGPVHGAMAYIGLRANL